MPAPTLAEVDAIAAMNDAVLRNLRITECYAELARGFEQVLPGESNWCHFATWASKQAGRSIRAEDLGLALETRLHKLPALHAIVAQLTAALGLQRDEIIAEIARVTLHAGGMQRSAAAVAEGNRKVFAEIGREFARCLEMIKSGRDTDASWAHCLSTLRPGEPPDGQSWLASAFQNYRLARVATGAERAQRALLANIQIGYHEQLRLQPEIQTAIDEAVLPHAILEQEVYLAITAKMRLLSRVWSWFVPARETLLRKAAKVIAAEAVKLARIVVTDHLMSIELPGPTVCRLGHDLQRPFPASLAHVELADLVQVLRRIDPTTDSTRGTGALDWADFRDRMHFIADLFRAWHGETKLGAEPFAADQLKAIRDGHRPQGAL